MLFKNLAVLGFLSSLALAVFPPSYHERGTPTLKDRAPPSCTTSLKTPSPTGYICGIAGTVKSAAPIATSVASTQDSCRAQCLNDPGNCISFSYDSSNEECITYRKKIIKSTFRRDSKSPKVFWNHFCYKRSCRKCPAEFPDKCSGECVNTDDDIYNCGKCNHACIDGAFCAQKTCGCPNNTSPCNGACINFAADSLNCGSCGTKCPTGSNCVNGSCTCGPSTTLAGLPPCNGDCEVDYATDPSNCGGCGNICGANSYCDQQMCKCPAGSTKCSTSPFADCQDITNDPENCGSCGNICPMGSGCGEGDCICRPGTTLEGFPPCNGSCAVDFENDADNCGGCMNSCGAGASCSQGSCTCPSGSALCSGSQGPCQDTNSDNNNCGGCGITCGTGASCSQGSCTCPSGSALCSGLQGPCQDTSSDDNNCGGCGNICPSGEVCQSGACGCGSGTTRCNGKCVDTLSDNYNCGTCNTSCPETHSCQNGACVLRPYYIHASSANATLNGLFLLTGDSYVSRFNTNNQPTGLEMKNPFVYNATSRRAYFWYNNNPAKVLNFAASGFDPQTTVQLVNGHYDDQYDVPLTCDVVTLSDLTKELKCSVVFSNGNTFNHLVSQFYSGTSYFLYLTDGSKLDSSFIDIRMIISQDPRQ